MRTFRSNGLEASAIGLGCASMSGLYGPSDDISSIELIHHALDKGVNFFDTANSYGWGHNEELLGRAIGARRNKAVIATKFGSVKLADGTIDYNGRPEFVNASCDARVAPVKNRNHRSLLPDEGRSECADRRHCRCDGGVGEAWKGSSPGYCRKRIRIRSGVQIPFILSRQFKVNIHCCIERRPKKPAQPRGVWALLFVAYSPLGRSFLAAQVQDLSDVAGDRRGQHPRFQGENFAANRELVRRLELIALDKGCTAAQLALAWLLAQGSDVLPIPGTEHRERFDENLGALSVQITPQDLDRIQAAIPIGTASGLRYPEPTMKNVYV